MAGGAHARGQPGFGWRSSVFSSCCFLFFLSFFRSLIEFCLPLLTSVCPLFSFFFIFSTLNMLSVICLLSSALKWHFFSFSVILPWLGSLLFPRCLVFCVSHGRCFSSVSFSLIFIFFFSLFIKFFRLFYIFNLYFSFMHCSFFPLSL